jgi:hypothetical protein
MSENSQLLNPPIDMQLFLPNNVQPSMTNLPEARQTKYPIHPNF